MNDAKRAFWSLYGRYVWDAWRTPWRAAQVRRVVGVLQERCTQPGERVLDAGCGTGHYALAMAQAGFQVIGIDYAPGMLARARAKVPRDLADALSFQQADLNARLSFPDTHFHHAINISVLQVVADPAYTLGELRRVLRPRGTLVLLHVPRPASHDLPLREAIGYRISDLEARTPWRVALVAAKVWAERRGVEGHWTVSQLDGMLDAGGFHVLSLDEGPPIVITAEKT
jgi:ubiquinone/menaquinone biosynthesis C-methylase UbiE